MKDLKGFAIGAKDGDIGVATDFIFDDKNWTVRYIVVDTNRWLPGRKVLISPIITAQADWDGKKIPVLLSQEQVKGSPDIRMDEELSAQDEMKYYDHYGWPYYWTGAGMWGPASVPQELLDTLPALLTIITLAGFVGRSRPPGGLGKRWPLD